MAETTAEVDASTKRFSHYGYPAMTKTQGSFSLHVEAGEFTDSEILVMLGENGTGKTTFIRMLHGSLKADDESVEVPEFKVSYKPQKISPKFPGTVRHFATPLTCPELRGLLLPCAMHALLCALSSTQSCWWKVQYPGLPLTE